MSEQVIFPFEKAEAYGLEKWKAIFRQKESFATARIGGGKGKKKKQMRS